MATAIRIRSKAAAADGPAQRGAADSVSTSANGAAASQQQHVGLAPGNVSGGGRARSQAGSPKAHGQALKTHSELRSMLLLVLLYLVQGVPLGLSTGALPFMLSAKVSYTQMGIFALAAYPYSLKLLWSPIVDSVYSRALGRRKSWIVPIQLLTAWLLVASAGYTERLYQQADVVRLTQLFFVFVFLMATQDIAVDGWALTLLSPANVAYASTCQTVGQTTGIFTSFTIFLALQDAGFSNKYLRTGALAGLFGSQPQDHGVVTLSGYLRFWGWAFAAITVFIAFFVRERDATPGEGPDGLQPLTSEQEALLSDGGAVNGNGNGSDPPTATAAAAAAAAGAGGKAGGGAGEDGGARRVMRQLFIAYSELWQVVKLPAVWRLTALLLTYRLGVLAAEGAAALKLIDKGVAKETLAFLVLFQFPVELVSALIAGRWAANHSPYPPFIIGYFLRLATACATVLLIAVFPPGASSLTEHGAAFGALAAVSLCTSFVSYLGFTALGSFYNSVSDPRMGGSYLTLLNTIANMGYLLPKTPLFWAMDVLTVANCSGPGDGPAGGGSSWTALACPKKMRDMAGSNACTDAGGSCALTSDGYYWVSCCSLVLGLALGLGYVGFVHRLMKLPLSRWRAPAASGAEAAKRTL